MASIGSGERRRRMACAAAWLWAAVATVSLTAGCARGPVGPASSTSETTATAPPAIAVAPADLEQMLPSEKRSQIASGFPAEVPVPNGEVRRGRAQGDGAWDYDLVVAAEPASVAAWYRRAYTSRSWVVMEDGYFDGEDGGGVFLTLRKGTAESRISVHSADPSVPRGSTRVVGVVGVGAPVLLTQ